jgi:hypothetical protein
VLNFSVLNSCRTAAVNAADITSAANLNAIVKQEDFIKCFSEIFSETLNITQSFKSGNTLKFHSDSERFAEITADFVFSNTTDLNNRQKQIVNIQLTTKYVFITSALRNLNELNSEKYTITIEKPFIIQIIN